MITIDEIYNKLKKSYEKESGLKLNDGKAILLQLLQMEKMV